ncbi:MAG: class I SAM-dependent methyltransferase [Thermoplasmata archaeon]|nr:class I SAM-dependent methyltransferase [Thermoplasmata archaeon]
MPDPSAPPTPTKTVWGEDSRIEVMRRLRSKGLAAGRSETDLLLEAAALRPGLKVLDVASGAGEPALEEARRVGASGHVTGVDPSDTLVSLAQEYARVEGLRQVEFHVGSAEELSFPAESFDRVTCRFGAMYFSDLARAITEALRVLRPGGKIAWLVWGPVEQPFFLSTVFVAMRHAGLSRLPPEATQPFRFAETGTITRALSAGGFVDVHEVSKEVMWSWPGSPEEVCDVFFSGAPPFKRVIDALDAKARTRAAKEITESMRSFESNGHVSVPETVILATGRKPGLTPT